MREHALHVMRAGVPKLLHYETGSDDRTVWGLGLGCNGSVDVFVQPATVPSALAVFSVLRDALDADAPLTLTTILEGPDAGRSAAHIRRASARFVGREAGASRRICQGSCRSRDAGASRRKRASRHRRLGARRHTAWFAAARLHRDARSAAAPGRVRRRRHCAGLWCRTRPTSAFG